MGTDGSAEPRGAAEPPLARLFERAHTRRALLQDAGVDGLALITPSWARAAILPLAAGIDPVTVASLLGHEDPHVTLKVYGHLFNRQSRDEAIRAAFAH